MANNASRIVNVKKRWVNTPVKARGTNTKGTKTNRSMMEAMPNCRVQPTDHNNSQTDYAHKCSLAASERRLSEHRLCYGGPNDHY